MADTFEITVHEQSPEENVTGHTVAADLDAAVRAAEAMHAYDLVNAGDEASGWPAATKERAEAGVAAALGIVAALGKKADHYRVTIHGGADHVNVSVQRLEVDA